MLGSDTWMMFHKKNKNFLNLKLGLHEFMFNFYTKLFTRSKFQSL